MRADGESVIITTMENAYNTRTKLQDTRLALDSLIRHNGDVERALDGWLRYAGLVFRVNEINQTSADVGLGVYRALLAARERN
jgi:molybdate-binding protein